MKKRGSLTDLIFYLLLILTIYTFIVAVFGKVTITGE